MSGIIRYEIHDDDLVVYVVQEGERFCIFGSFSFVCLAGNVTVNDYHVKTCSYDKKNLIKVSAPERMDIPIIVQVHQNDPNYKLSRLKFRLKAIESNYEHILNEIGNSNPAVFVFNKNLDPIEETMTRLIPNFLIHSSRLTKTIKPPHYFIKAMELYVYPEHESNEIDLALESLQAKRKNGQRVSILPIGHKGAGKSNLIRNLVNRLISKGVDNLYILDGDIGQSEFTPCGCMSLTKIKAPIFDKPYGHQKIYFEDSYFYGDITVTNKELYVDIFERLWNSFSQSSPPESVCIINSMGWIEGLGREILLNIANISKPDVFVEIFRTFTEGRFNFPATFKPKVEICVNSISPDFSIPTQAKISPTLHRDLTTLGYFASLLIRPTISCIFEQQPYKIAFNKMVICLPSEQLVEDRMILASINTQLLAICVYNSEINFRRICEIEQFPRVGIIDRSTPALKCIGFAVVRAISLEKQEVYLITPVNLSQLDEIPIFVKGMRINTPQQMFTEHKYKKSPYVLQYDQDRSLHEELYRAPVFSTGFKRSRNN